MKTLDMKTGKLKRISKRKQSPNYQGGLKATHRFIRKLYKNKHEGQPPIKVKVLQKL